MRSAAHRLGRVALGAALAALLGCAARRAPVPAEPVRFTFATDTFAFANETVWEYQVDPQTGATRWWKRDPPPPFALRCGNMARAARQFRLHARFAPDAPRVDAATYADLVERILARDARARTPSADPVVVPGYPDLRTFSADQAALLQDRLGGSWRSYLQRGNWRMIFPFTEGHQRETAEQLAREVAAGRSAVVHVLRYPELTINHMVLVYAAEADAAEIRFEAYDPNDAERPLVLAWDRGAGQFVFPRTIYFGGGPVRAYEVYDGLLY